MTVRPSDLEAALRAARIPHTAEELLLLVAVLNARLGRERGQ